MKHSHSFIDLSGQKFGKLTIISYHRASEKERRALWLCQCECGNQTTTSGKMLRSGHTKSCGCLQSETTAKRNFRHGFKKRNAEDVTGGAYECWCKIRQRCNNPNCDDYEGYGAKGIKVCDRWDVFENFLADMGSRPAPHLSIHRLKNELGYSPDNCIWADAIVQANNKTNNRRIDCFGKSQTASEWSRESGIHVQTILTRLKLKWPTELALTKPPDRSFRTNAAERKIRAAV